MKRILILTCVIAGLATSAFANAKGDHEALAALKIDAAAAAQAAEAHTPGKITSLDVDQDDKSGEPLYKVEIIDTAGKEHKLEVNGLTGAVSAAQTDSDHDGDDGDSD